jgi:hypothetical protein
MSLNAVQSVSWSVANSRQKPISQCKTTNLILWPLIGYSTLTSKPAGNAVVRVRIMPKALASLAGQALACIEDPVVIGKIISISTKNGTAQETGLLTEGLVSPAGLFV